MRFSKSSLFNATRFKHELKNNSSTVSVFKRTLKTAIEQLKKHQNTGISAATIIENFTWLVDQLIIQAWQHNQHLLNDETAIELVAVGGYGRAELHPYSDIDVLILSSDNNYQQHQIFLEAFIQLLWDTGFDVGHSVRSIKECIKEARQDLSTMTNLLETRHLAGNVSILPELDTKLRNTRLWSANKFFTAKIDEQDERHSKFFDSGYSLEPNIKESPGGLRDLQTILWVYNRAYNIKSFKELNQQGFINDSEYRLLIRSRNILWKLRTGLHLLNNRREDRFLFDSQRQLSSDFGYQDSQNQLAVEQLMKRYYRTTHNVLYLNEILLSHYRVSHSKTRKITASKKIDKHFILKNKMIETNSPTLFAKKPTAMLTLFTLMQEHKITSIHPDTIRSLRANLDKINNQFRNDKTSQRLFLKLFTAPGIGLTNALMRMNSYGLLGAYLPVFGAIVGQMQHDLFHVYTVDGHTLIVIRNLTRLRKYPDEYPLAGNLLNNLYKPERLFIAALFHDIGKGRGGDHSELGQIDAIEFCKQHGLSDNDSEFVGWLVLKHLLMSHFSQRRDITDPAVIQEFAQIVGDIEHLDNLYLLTHADIRGTSPKVWSAWKGQLLLDLYHATRQALERGIAKPRNEEKRVKEEKKQTLALLEQQKIDINPSHIEQFWNTLSNDYFLRNEPYYLAWHITNISQTPAIALPIVSTRYSERLEANMFFIYAPITNNLLTQVTASFDQMGINIVEARLQQSNNGFALYSLYGIVSDNQESNKKRSRELLETRLRELILQYTETKPIRRQRSSRALKHFPIKPSIKFSFNNQNNYTIMEILAQDQPGLLHNVATILEQHKIKLLSAKIATLGERAEDVLFIQDSKDNAVRDTDTLTQLEQQLCQALNQSPKT